MRKIYLFPFTVLLLGIIFGCEPHSKESSSQSEEIVETDTFTYFSEKFADLKLLRYKIPGFEELNLKQKELLYYLSQAALSGRDIIWDQNYKHNLLIRKTLEAIVNSYSGDRNSEGFKRFMVYTKRVWFSNGIHHHYSTMKIDPEFDENVFAELINNSNNDLLPLQEGESTEQLLEKISPLIFDLQLENKRVNKANGVDQVIESANNFYENISQQEVEEYYESVKDRESLTPISYGLNSKLIKNEDEVVQELVWKKGGMYTEAIEKINYWLAKAATVAETEQQKITIEKLIEYYESGDLKLWDAYNIEWVKDTAARIDFINGFIENYGDPLGYKASFESVVSFKDLEATKRISAIAKEAKWFEDNSPIMEDHKKKEVQGITGKVITVVTESGDASPSTPIGINLPNARWIRKNHGSKSVNLGNIVHAYDMGSKGGGFLEEFAYDKEEIELSKKYSAISDILHTDMHEVIGHASGQLMPGVGEDALKNYGSTLEEARADLVALYYLRDPKLVNIGVLPDLDAGKVAYIDYITNGIMFQLKRIKLGDEIEEDHMRNRQLVAMWVYEKGKADKVVEKVSKNNKTYFIINDYEKCRTLFGELLREIQRIISEGDYEAGKLLVETYGIKVDHELHQEVLERFNKLNIAPYGGFINPVLVPTYEGEKIVAITVSYPTSFEEQMLHYSKSYSFLPVKN